MNLLKLKFFYVSAAFILSISANGDTFTTDKGDVKFLAIGKPSALKIRGETESLTGTANWPSIASKSESVLGTFTVDLNTLKTGIGLRDDHMKNKYLEVGKFPNATLQITKVNLTDWSTLPTGNEINSDFEGKLNLHGVEKPIQGKIKIKKTSDSIFTLESSFNLQITSYGIAVPNWAGIKVTDEVQLEIKTEMKKN